MEREIVLTSYSKNLYNNNNKPEDFTVKCNKPLVLDSNDQYAVALNRIIDMSFTWYNIEAKRNNQLIRYSSDGGKTFHDITFPGGVWEYESINKHIQEKTVIKQSGEKDVFPISLTFDNATFRVLIVMKENYQLDLTQSNFYDLIGFDKVVLKEKTNIGPRVPNLAQDTEMLNIHCNLTSESLVDGEDTDIIYFFSTSVLKPSYSFTLEPKKKMFSPVNKNRINSIRIYITDGKRRVINLNGTDTAFH